METEKLVRCLEHCSKNEYSCDMCELYGEKVGSIRYVDFILKEAAAAIKGLLSQLQEREDALCLVRKNWHGAEALFCSMCGHFDHKTDGNIVYGNTDCGEIAGFPCCGKFTPWIPASVRLPDKELEEHRKKYAEVDLEVIVMIKGAKEPTTLFYNEEGEFYGVFEDGETVFYLVTHWMPMPEVPKEGSA